MGVSDDSGAESEGEDEDEIEDIIKKLKDSEKGKKIPVELDPCQLIVCGIALNWFIVVPLLGVYMVYVSFAVYSIWNQYQTSLLQCPLDVKTMSKVETSYWDEWTEYSECTVTCGNGVRSRRRSCILSSLKNAKNCEGEERETSECIDQPQCYIPPVSAWTEWTEFGPCSVTCETGEKSRTRICAFPTGEEASDCEGDNNKETVECAGVKENCPINGGWSEWTSWTDCSLTCGHGEIVRSRTCTHPEPLFDGADCVGSGQELETCTLAVCLGQSSWSMWSEYTECTVTCGEGTYSRNRTCTYSTGLAATDCEGDANQVSPCTGTVQPNCAIHGGWTEWSTWSDCSVTCGNGVKRITRTCDNPEPQHGGENCEGNAETTSTCSMSPCAVHGGWTEWTQWSDCDVTCENGLKRRNRKCENPEPEHGGDLCDGISLETTTCAGPICPIHGGWTGWSAWISCSVTCGDGVKKRRRKCEMPRPQFGGRDCEGSDEKSGTCSRSECIGDWNQWKSWGSCKHPFCEEGVRKRERECNPSNCIGSNMETRSCVTGCPSMRLNEYFTEGKFELGNTIRTGNQFAFIAMYMQITYNATVHKAYVWTSSHSTPFYISFWAPRSYSGRSEEQFYLKLKKRVRTTSAGLQAISMKVCVQEGWYVGFHYDADGRSRWDSSNNGVITYKNWIQPDECPYYFKRAYDINWQTGKKVEFEKASSMSICPSLILKLKCIGCHYVHLNNHFYHPSQRTTLSKFEPASNKRFPKFTNIYMHMRFMQDGHIFKMEYIARAKKKRIYLHFYEPEDSSTGYPGRRNFILRKKRDITSQKNGINKISNKYTFKKGWYLGTSYRHSDSLDQSVIPWEDLPDSSGSQFFTYYTTEMDKDWNTGKVVVADRASTKKAVTIIAQIKYDC